MSEDKRTYEDIIKSFIVEINNRGANVEYNKLTDHERLELLDILMKQCNEHMRPFVVHVLGYKWHWFHDYWFESFKKYDINCVIAARGCGKSFYWTQMLTEYMNFIQKRYKTIISSFNAPATFDFLKYVRDDIENNELLLSKMPESKSSDWNKGNLEFSNRSHIKGISITSQIRRVHVNYFVADDILNDDVELSPEEVKKKVYATILPVINIRRGKFAIIGTKFAEDDIYSFLYEKAKEQKTYHHMELRIELDEKEEKAYFILETEEGIIKKVADTGNTDIYSYEFLLSLKQVEPNYFYREYGCQIVSGKDVPFPLDILHDCRDKELSYEEERDSKKVYIGGLDSAVSTNKGSDESVLMLGYQDKEDYIIPAHIYADNTLDAPERTTELKKVMDKFNRPIVLAEKNSIGQTNIDYINKESFHLVPFFTTNDNKIDLTEYASRLVKGGKVKFPYKKPRDQLKTDKLIHQLSGVREKRTRGGKKSYDGTTKHDDWYIAFILMIKQMADRKGMPTKIKSYKRNELY
jgi:hypothetical protein